MAGKLGDVGINSGLKVIGVAVSIAVLTAVVPTLVENTGGLISYFNNETTTLGDTTADGLLGLLPLIIGVTFVASLIGVIVARMKLSNGRN